MQEEFEVQSRIDDEKLALERKALELRELRQKRLIEEKYRAMEEIATSRCGSSDNGRADTRRSTQSDAHSRAESWVLEQRKQNYRPENGTEDVKPTTVRETLGVDLSVPLNVRELDTLRQMQGAEGWQRDEDEVNSDHDDGTYIIEQTRQSFRPLTSATPAYHHNREVQPSRTYDGRLITTRSTNGNEQMQRFDILRSSGQQWSNDRVVQSSSRPNQQAIKSGNLRSSQSSGNGPPNIRRVGPNNQTSQQSVGTRQTSSQQQQLHGNQQLPNTLNSSQIASRQSMPKDLPLFYGHPHDWPQFIKRYYNTTSLCGFSDSENLERLNKCLKGKAKDIVESLLVMPECVDEIIETLREKFGRPELVAKATLAKIKAEQPIKYDKLEALSDFGYKVRNACNVIESMGLHYHLYSPDLIQDVIGKLPSQIKIEWAIYADSIQRNNQCINLRTIAEWLHRLARTLSQVTTLDLDSLSLSSDPKNNRKTDNIKSGFVNVHDAKATTSEVEQSKCVSCSSSCKNVVECLKFKGLNTDERWKCVTESNLCRKCLTNHGRKSCPAKKFPCGVNGCELKHNRLLHNEDRHAQYRKDKSDDGKQKPNLNSGKSSASEGQRANSSTITPKPSNTHQVFDDNELFRIIPVEIKNNGHAVRTFAFLDEGSSYTLMEEETANKLNVEGTTETICLLWTSGVHRQEESLNVDLEISGTSNGDATYPMRSVNVVKELGLSPQSVDPEDLSKRFAHLKGLPLPKYCNAVPTILIGVKHIRLSTPLESVEGEDNQPIASRSRLGWTVYGPTGGTGSFNYVNHHKIQKCPCSDRDDNLHDLIKEHFSIDNFGVSINSMNTESKENQRALEMLKKFTVRKENRFETRLLWKNDAYMLPDSYNMARKRLTCLENKGPEVVNIINEIIEDYLVEGYASKLSLADLETKHARTFYLPIFTVTNLKKPGKIRPVFDAAATVNGVSLNSTLLTGPDLLSPLVDILRRFREHQIAVVGDIKDMFHRIWINEADRNSQRFLWRNGDRSREPDVYQFNVMLFGSK